MTKATTKVPVPFAGSAGSHQPNQPTKWDSFRLQRKILLVFGIWPGDRTRRRWYVKALIAVNLVSLAVCMVGEFLHGLYAYQDGDLSEAIESLCPTVSRVCGFLRMVIYLVNEVKIERVLLNMEHLLRNQNPREESINQRMTFLGQRYTQSLWVMMFFAALLYGINPFLIMMYSWHQGQRPLIKLLPFKLALPFDAQNLRYYVLTTLFLNYASAPTITSQTGSDALFSGVCLYVHGQFKCIRLDIETLAVSAGAVAGSLKADPHEVQRVNGELRRISVRHQRTIDMAHEVRRAFAPNVLLVYACTALILCFVCVAMLIVEGVYKLTYLPYAFAELVILFLYSNSGTRIRDSSEAIKTVAYSFPWYRYDRNTRHLIQMMMLRAQYGSNMDVPFFETSMATFSAIVRTASSYITLMKSFL